MIIKSLSVTRDIFHGCSDIHIDLERCGNLDVANVLSAIADMLASLGSALGHPSAVPMVERPVAGELLPEKPPVRKPEPVEPANPVPAIGDAAAFEPAVSVPACVLAPDVQSIVPPAGPVKPSSESPESKAPVYRDIIYPEAYPKEALVALHEFKGLRPRERWERMHKILQLSTVPLSLKQLAERMFSVKFGEHCVDFTTPLSGVVTQYRSEVEISSYIMDSTKKKAALWRLKSAKMPVVPEPVGLSQATLMKQIFDEACTEKCGHIISGDLLVRLADLYRMSPDKLVSTLAGDWDFKLVLEKRGGRTLDVRNGVIVLIGELVE